MDIVNDLDGYHLAYWADQMPAEAVVMGAPPGHEDDIAACSAIRTAPKDDEYVVRVAWKPNEIDLMHLAKGGTIWLSTWGGLPPHMLEVQPPTDPFGSSDDPPNCTTQGQ